MRNHTKAWKPTILVFDGKELSSTIIMSIVDELCGKKIIEIRMMTGAEKQAIRDNIAKGVKYHTETILSLKNYDFPVLFKILGTFNPGR